MKKLLISVAAVLGSVTLLTAQTPSVAAGGVLNGASFERNQAVAPGSLVSIFGSNLAAGLAQNDTVPLSTTLSNVAVTMNGIPAGLYFVSTEQINAQVPWNVLPNGAASGTATVVVTRNGVASPGQAFNVTGVAAGIFSIPAGAGWAIAINTDGSLAAPEGAIPGFPTHPVTMGDPIAILGTGLGAVTPPVQNGHDTVDGLRTAVTQPTILVGGRSAVVGFAGLAPQFPGVNQINIIVPTGLTPGVVPLQIQSGAITSTDQVKIAVR